MTALTNAEKQARWRQRRRAELDALRRAAKPAGPDPRDDEIARLKAENAQLRARPVAGGDEDHHHRAVKKLVAKTLDLEAELRTPFVDGDVVAYVAAMRRRIPHGDLGISVAHEDLLNEVRAHAPAKIRKIHQSVERKIAKFEALLPTKGAARRLKIAALAAEGSGATKGERAAAIEAQKRLKG